MKTKKKDARPQSGLNEEIAEWARAITRPSRLTRLEALVESTSGPDATGGDLEARDELVEELLPGLIALARAAHEVVVTAAPGQLAGWLPLSIMAEKLAAVES